MIVALGDRYQSRLFKPEELDRDENRHVRAGNREPSVREAPYAFRARERFRRHSQSERRETSASPLLQAYPLRAG